MIRLVDQTVDERKGVPCTGCVYHDDSIACGQAGDCTLYAGQIFKETGACTTKPIANWNGTLHLNEV